MDMDDNLQGVGSAPGLVERAKAMIVSPKSEWPKVAAETDDVRNVFMRYVVPLAAIGPLAGFIGGQAFGLGAFGISYTPSLMGGLTTAITSYVLALASIFLISWIASFLAAKFGGKESFARAFRLCAYAFTAAWVAGIFGLVPALGILSLLGLYSLYVFYLGAEPMMGVPQDKAAGYTAVTVIAAFVLYLLAGVVVGAVAATGSGRLSGLSSSAAGDTVEVNVPGYGQMRIEDNGDTQTMEIPGVGTVEVTRDGDTLRIDGENFDAEIEDPQPAE
jgi:hypothetical protein